MVSQNVFDTESQLSSVLFSFTSVSKWSAVLNSALVSTRERRNGVGCSREELD